MKKHTTKFTLSPYLNRQGEVIDNKLRVEADGLELTLIKRGKFWSTRFMIDGKHANVNLRTTCERTAAKTALDKAIAALQGRWGTVVAGQQLRTQFITIGEIIEIYLASPAPRAAASVKIGNCNALRRFIRIGKGLDDRAEVDHLGSGCLNVALIRDYQAVRLEGVAEGKGLERRKRSINSAVADARSVFANYLLDEELYPNLPDLIAFKKVQPLPAMRVEYRHEEVAKWVKVVLAHLPELRESDPAAYLLFQLAAGLGLRRGEAMQARKSWITELDGTRVLYVQPTEDWLPKGRKERKVPLPDSVYQEILLLSDDSEYIVPASTRRYWTPAYTNKAGTVVKGAWREKQLVNHDNERKYGVSRRLNLWFVDLGWPFAKKIHKVRAWYGAHVSTQHGLFAAQRLLGHADPQTTNQYYADLVEIPVIEIDLTGGTAIVPRAVAK